MARLVLAPLFLFRVPVPLARLRLTQCGLAPSGGRSQPPGPGRPWRQV